MPPKGSFFPCHVLPSFVMGAFQLLTLFCFLEIFAACLIYRNYSGIQNVDLFVGYVYFKDFQNALEF